jgi:hypothetical protein
MRRGPKIILTLLIIAVVCLAPGTLIRWTIEQAVAGKVSGMLGTARSYSVDVSSGLFDILRGRLQKVDIRGNDVKLSNGVVVDRLDVNLSGVHFKPNQTVTGVDSTAFTASLSEGNMDDYLRASRSDLSDADVSLTDGKLSLTARPRVLAIRTPVRVEGTMRIVQGTKLYLVLNRLSARGMRVPGMIRGHIQHDLNPVLDTQQMGMGAKLTKVAIANGEIELSGTADVKQALAAK